MSETNTSNDSTTAKARRRNAAITAIDVQLGRIKDLQESIARLVETIEGEWVIRRRVLEDRDPDRRFYGVRNPGDTQYAAGFLFRDPFDVNKGFSGKIGGVKVFKSPRDAVFVAECEAGRDTRYESQDRYVIEIVDRLDGEVYEKIEKGWRNHLLYR